MGRNLAIVPAKGRSFEDHFNSIMMPLWALDELIDFAEGQNASIKVLLNLVVQDAEMRLRNLAEEFDLSEAAHG